VADRVVRPCDVTKTAVTGSTCVCLTNFGNIILLVICWTTLKMETARSCETVVPEYTAHAFARLSNWAHPY